MGRGHISSQMGATSCLKFDSGVSSALRGVYSTVLEFLSVKWYCSLFLVGDGVSER